MSSYELLAPRKNWTDLVVNSVDSTNITTSGRIRQDDNRLTPVALWACTGNFSTSNTTPTFSMGTFVGPVHIDPDAVYSHMSTRIVVSGILNTPGESFFTISIRDLTGTYIHSSVFFHILAFTSNATVFAEFNIQVSAPGGPGVGFQRSVATMSINNQTSTVGIISDNTTFDSTNGLDYYLYVQHSAPGCTFTRQLAYANILI